MLSVLMTKDDRNSENSCRNSEYGPGARYTITNRTGFKAFQVWCVRLRIRLSNESWLFLGLGLINRLELKMAATPSP